MSTLYGANEFKESWKLNNDKNELNKTLKFRTKKLVWKRNSSKEYKMSARNEVSQKSLQDKDI